MENKLAVLVTGVGGRAVGHQILHALLLLGDTYQVVASDAEAFSFGLYLVQDRHLLPVANDPAYLPTLMEIIARHKIRAILPGTEAEGRVLVAHVEPLAARGCVLISSPGEVVRLCADKGALSQWLMEHGYEVPLTVNADQWHRLVSVTGFPIVGKPAKLSGGSRDVALLNDEAEVERYLAQRPQGLEVIFQQYVGSADAEYTVGVMVSKSGQIIDSIAMHRKLIGLSLGQSRRLQGGNFALSTGYSQGFIVKHTLIQEKCEELALRLGVRGPANFQLRLVGKRVVFFEVHPRFSGTSSIRASVGFNEPDVLIRNFVLNETFRRLSYQTEVAAIRAFQHAIVPLSAVQAMEAARCQPG